MEESRDQSNLKKKKKKGKERADHVCFYLHCDDVLQPSLPGRENS
jgi:hypothetical protein